MVHCRRVAENINTISESAGMNRRDFLVDLVRETFEH